MNTVTILWSMLASACLTLAGIHALVWWRERQARGNLCFALAALGTAGLAACEYWMMRSTTPAEFGLALRWLHVPAWVLILALVGFIRIFLRSGRAWLAWAVAGVRTLSLVIGLYQAPNLNYREITGLRPIEFLGNTVMTAEGVPNPWMLVGQASLLLLVVFVLDAALAAWRRGHRRRAAVVGGSILLFVSAGAAQSVLVLWNLVEVPLTPSLFFLGIVGAMSYELSLDVINAGRLSRELDRQRAELARVHRATALGGLAASLAHELNQPLTGILANAQAGEWLLRRQPPDLAGLREALASVVTDTQRASEILCQVRVFLSGKCDTPRQTLDLNRLVHETLRLGRGETSLRDLAIRTELSPGLPAVHGDPVQLQQVLINLLVNAGQAMASVPPAERRLVVRTSRDAATGGATVELDDSGPGFAPAVLDRVFEPFFTTRPEGMGLGLAICRSILETHGGRIQAGNHPGGGARVTCWFPAAERLQPAPAPAGNPGLAPA